MQKWKPKLKVFKNRTRVYVTFIKAKYLNKFQLCKSKNDFRREFNEIQICMHIRILKECLIITALKFKSTYIKIYYISLFLYIQIIYTESGPDKEKVSSFLPYHRAYKF